MYDDYKKQYAVIVIGAVILVLSLIWKDLIVDLQNKMFPKKHTLIGDTFFAIAITGLGVLAVVFLRNSLNIDQNI